MNSADIHKGSPPPLTFQRIEPEGYRLTDAVHGIVLEVTRLRRERQDLRGELAVSCRMLGARQSEGGFVSVANFNLSNARERKERAFVLAERSRAPKVDWTTLLEELCQRVLAAERQGEPSVALRDLPAPSRDEEFSIDGLTFPAKHGAILFGDGGTLKSYLQLYVGGVLARGGLRVGYFDWELDQWTHRPRLEQLFGSNMPDVRYVRCDRPLVYEVDRLAQIVRREGLDYALFDSIGFACDGPPEAAESALTYFRVARYLGIGGLHSAHITKNGDNAEQRPFGSAFFHNSARSTWFVKRAGASGDGQVVTIGLFNRKPSPFAPARPPIAFDVSFADGRTVFTRVDVATVDELVTALPLKERIRGLMKTGTPRTIAAIAEALDAEKDSVEAS